ncbi:uncharacterized protein LOC120674571 [Panicum virgatum]|uniref:uncharacterized protein LOC120674571 n=1 Tax=Panicum virgatum TaxID=38727 RepID=UPI0019D55050|nr:uncharacterized protein LOC120674571 [Panicum virgatum]
MATQSTNGGAAEQFGLTDKPNRGTVDRSLRFLVLLYTDRFSFLANRILWKPNKPNRIVGFNRTPSPTVRALPAAARISPGRGAELSGLAFINAEKLVLHIPTPARSSSARPPLSTPSICICQLRGCLIAKVWHYFLKVLVKLHKLPIAAGRDLQFGNIMKNYLMKERQNASIAAQNLLITKD